MHFFPLLLKITVRHEWHARMTYLIRESNKLCVGHLAMAASLMSRFSLRAHALQNSFSFTQRHMGVCDVPQSGHMYGCKTHRPFFYSTLLLLT